MPIKNKHSASITGLIAIITFVLVLPQCKQSATNPLQEPWHGKQRELRYRPVNNEFVINNGTHRFNRALYGGNTGFRVETGDLPEFALYMPRMGGTLRLGIISSDSSKWLINSQNIEARYGSGKMTYKIKDPMFGKGSLSIEVLALYQADGFTIRIRPEKIPDGIQLFWAFGGATGKRFSREGDLGADPESNFYLQSENCINNEIFIDGNNFHLYYASGRTLPYTVQTESINKTTEEINSPHLMSKKRIFGAVSVESKLRIGDATNQESPLKMVSDVVKAPVVIGSIELKRQAFYLYITNPDTGINPESTTLEKLYQDADSARLTIADRFYIETPDPYLNTAASQLVFAADAIWDGQSFMHGAVAWRMPLNGWRGAYAADWLGWHDRAKTHFTSYFKAQYTEPVIGPIVPDPKTHLARQTEEAGKSLFTEGYISRSPGKINKPHHYDMNLVFIDQLLSHFKWTGDLEFLRESWPVLERHLKWEKRNFDANNDGLYDAYASIWASDALQYSGGGVTHSTAYNYRANKMAAELAPLIGKDPCPYAAEAKKIKQAVQQQLWLPEKGWYAEYKDLLGNELIHPAAGLWTVYHAIDEGLADPFQAYQTTRYVDNYIPHIPVMGTGLPEGNYYTLSTSNWMPYTWSINNVAMAEVLNTALAYWQSGRSENALHLMKSTLLDFMYMGTSPGNYGQLSFHDAFRGELYRDFADPVGVAARTFVEGLFGVTPDLLHHKLTITPGWPANWKFAKLYTPDLNIDFKRKNNTDTYQIEQNFTSELNLSLKIKAKSARIKSILVNQVETEWNSITTNVGEPVLEITAPAGRIFTVKIEWGNEEIEQPTTKTTYVQGELMRIDFERATIISCYDPQRTFDSILIDDHFFQGKLSQNNGSKTTFIQLSQGKLSWWQPLDFTVVPSLAIQCSLQTTGEVAINVENNTAQLLHGNLTLNDTTIEVTIGSNKNVNLKMNPKFFATGSNIIEFQSGNIKANTTYLNWKIEPAAEQNYECIDLSEILNDQLTGIFREQYVSPRAPYSTLSIPIQGIGDWCSFAETAIIDDSGLRRIAGINNRITTPQGIPFETPGDSSKNICFTSQWDNYPDSTGIKVSGFASHLYLLMAGSAHHMQCRMEIAFVTAKYTDGSVEKLPLISPNNWWPIEQDFYHDSFAFDVPKPEPLRLHIKSGEWHIGACTTPEINKTVKIDGGAATVLDLVLNPKKELESISLETIANDVVVGIMAATLVR